MDRESFNLAPFGYGLSFSQFVYKVLNTSKTDISPNDSLIVSVNVTNSGIYDGDEVVQLYVRNLSSNKPQPIRSLKGFRRVSIKKVEIKTIKIPLKTRDLRIFDEQKNGFIVEPGKYEIQIGASFEDIRLKSILLVK